MTDTFEPAEIAKTVTSLNEEIMRAERLKLCYPELAAQWDEKAERLRHAVRLIEESYL